MTKIPLRSIWDLFCKHFEMDTLKFHTENDFNKPLKCKICLKKSFLPLNEWVFSRYFGQIHNKTATELSSRLNVKLTVLKFTVWPPKYSVQYSTASFCVIKCHQRRYWTIPFIIYWYSHKFIIYFQIHVCNRVFIFIRVMKSTMNKIETRTGTHTHIQFSVCI